MSSKLPVTAIFDIGKTNKKLLFFDKELSVVHKTNRIFDEITDDDGYPCDDLAGLTDWMYDEMEKMAVSHEFDVQAINFSGYGASLVHLNKKNRPVTPIYNYLKPYPEKLSEEFFQKYRGEKQFSIKTASPPMGMLNSGLQIYWLKRMKPQIYEQIDTSLHFPQYLSYLITRKSVSEITSIGCHTGMWNFEKNRYHHWIEEEDVGKLLPAIKPAQQSYSAEYKSLKVNSGIGIHDSSAALASYLMAFDDPFMLLSTGTWSIAMNPFTSEPLTYSELKQDCLHYLNVYGNPVKASRFMLGGEYSHHLNKMGRFFGRTPTRFDCDPDISLMNKLISENENRYKKRLVLEKSQTSGPFPSKKGIEWDLSQFDRYEEAAHQCLLDLASIQASSLKLAEGSNRIKKIILTGGFAKNAFFCRLLSSMLPDKNLYTASLPEASALGAALVLKKPGSIEKLRNRLELNLQKPIENLNLHGYSWSDESDLRKNGI